MNKTILIAGGGTGGHLFPAISIGEELMKNNFSIIFIGSKFGIENKYFKNRSYKYHLLNIRGIQRNLSIKSISINILFPIKFILSYLKSLILILKYKPCAIIGTGGYASGLPLIAGIICKTPIFIQDQNSIPGMITKKLHNYTKKIFLGYPTATNLLDIKKCTISGNPIKHDLKKINKIKAKEDLQFKRNKKLILIIGGSQGAEAINTHIIENINFYINNNYQILWQSGNSNYQTIKNKINNKLIKIVRFIEDMSLAYSSADIVISRAGAIAISELAFYQKAMILIPLPSSAENHQELNANFLNKKNACIKVNQKDLNNGNLEKSIYNLLENDKEIKILENNTKHISKNNACKIIVNEIIKQIS